MSSLNYVILCHEQVDEPHYDLMFETLPGSMLATWRSLAWPIQSPTPLLRLRDHRRLYLTYEGDLPGHRGSVRRIGQGTCEVVVGEQSVWTIRLLTGSSPQTLLLRQLGSDQWQAEPK